MVQKLKKIYDNLGWTLTMRTNLVWDGFTLTLKMKEEVFPVAKMINEIETDEKKLLML